MLLNRRLRNLIILIIVIVLCLIVITVSFKGIDLIENIRTRILDFFLPVQEKLFAFFSPVTGFFNFFTDYINLRSEYLELKQENSRLRKEYANNINLVVENEHLRKLLDIELRKDFNTLPAKVIGFYENKWQSEILLNVGKRDGIQEGMGVINDSGLIGIVIQSGDRSCNVRLIDDPQTSIGVRILSSRKLGIIEGSQDKTINLNYISTEEQVYKGDIIITSEFGQFLPPELLVGRVSQAANMPGSLYKEIEIEPFVDFREIEYVLIIKG